MVISLFEIVFIFLVKRCIYSYSGLEDGECHQKKKEQQSTVKTGTTSRTLENSQSY